MPSENNYFKKKIEDWEVLKLEYIQGWLDEDKNTHYYPTLKEIAEKYNIAPTTVRIASSKGRWGELKALVKAKLKEQRTINELRDVISASSNFDAATLDAAGKSYRVINHLLDGYIGHIESGDINCGEEEEDSRPKVKASDVKVLVDSLKGLNELTRRVLGDDGSVESISAEIKRLEEDRKTEEGSDEKVDQLQGMLNDIKRARRELEDKKRNP